MEKIASKLVGLVLVFTIMFLSTAFIMQAQATIGGIDDNDKSTYSCRGIPDLPLGDDAPEEQVIEDEDIPL